MNLLYNYLKRIKDKTLYYIIPKIAWLYVKITFLTCNFKIQIEPNSLKIINSKKNCIFAFWHNNLLLMPYIMHYKLNIIGWAVVSTHKDGEYLTQFLKLYKHKAIRGSSNKGSIEAMKNIIALLKNNQNIKLAITPDGPKGPIYHINGNIVKVANLMNVPIIPISYQITRGIELKTWDKMNIPIIFKSKIQLKIEKPITVSELNKLAEKYNNSSSEMNKYLKNIMCL